MSKCPKCIKALKTYNTEVKKEMTFNFTATQVMGTVEDPREDLVKKAVTCTIPSIDFKTADFAGGTGVYTKLSDKITFDAFTEAGKYEYTVKESASDPVINAESKYEKLIMSKAEYTMDVYVVEDRLGAFNIEKHYSKIVPHITCEEYLGECITDYKFFCFNGEPKYIYVSSDLIHDRQAQIGFFYLDGTKMPLIRDDYAPMNIEELPPFFENMKKDAEVLCEDFPFVRVDFFVANNTYYFAELTFTPSGGMMPFNPDKYDLKWGENLDISINIK